MGGGVVKPLPQNLDTEQALLGALLKNPTVAARKCWDASLTAADFGREQHGVIYDAIIGCVKRGEDVDEFSLVDDLRRQEVPAERGKTVNALQYVGGAPFVLSLADRGVVSVVGAHAAEIVSQALSRELMAVGDELVNQGAELAPIADAVTAAERRLAHARDRAEGRFGNVRRSDVADALQRVLSDYISGEPDDLVPFGLPKLNAIGGGMAPGDVVVVGARSGVGKTWWGLDAVEIAMGAGRRSVVFSLEMPQEQLVRRLLAMGGLNLTGIKRREVPYDSMESRITTIDSWQGMLDIEDGPTTVDRMQAVLASARIDGRPYRVVVLDHLHLLDVPGSRADYRVALNQELTRIKHMAGEHGCTVILLAQLNRPRKGDEKNRPTIHDLRESGGIGDIADYVLLLHREPDGSGYPTNQGVVIVEKVRDGAGACDVDVVFDPRSYRFREGFLAGFSGRVA
jgi:replicative DNA helicase